ncbi:hypothetical protein Ancab_040518 [Ancistrocladus abbreviatus]
MDQACVMRRFEGCQVGKEDFRISFLQYADDTLIMGNATEENVWAIKCVLRGFELVSGIRVNYHKSALIGIYCDSLWLNRMADALYYKVTSSIKYLGVQLGMKIKKKAIWEPVINAMKKRVSGWHLSSLSFSGRVVLINAVLGSLPIYHLALFLAPLGVIKKLEQIRMHFLWGSTDDRRKMVWVKWEDVCKKKIHGGLGIKDLRQFNIALVGKWWWRYLQEENRLWRRLLVAKYGDNSSGVCESSRNDKSFSGWWRDVLQIGWNKNNDSKEISKEFHKVVGDGKHTSFWFDKWCGSSSLVHVFPRLFALSGSRHITVAEQGGWIDKDWVWDFKWRRPIRDSEKESVDQLLNLVRRYKLNKKLGDRWQWSSGKGGKYSVKAAYDALYRSRSLLPMKIFKKVWNNRFPSNIRSFSWRCILNRLPTKENLSKRGLISNVSERSGIAAVSKVRRLWVGQVFFMRELGVFGWLVTISFSIIRRCDRTILSN